MIAALRVPVLIRRQVAAKHQAAAIEAARAAPNERAPKQLAALVRFLKLVPEFAPLPDWHLTEVARFAPALDYEAGNICVSEGAMTGAAFVVLRGSFAVCEAARSRAPQQEDSSEMQPPRPARLGGVERALQAQGMFGAEQLSTCRPFRTSLFCTTSGVLLRIPGTDFRCALSRCRAALTRCVRLLLHRWHLRCTCPCHRRPPCVLAETWPAAASRHSHE